MIADVLKGAFVFFAAVVLQAAIVSSIDPAAARPTSSSSR